MKTDKRASKQKVSVAGLKVNLTYLKHWWRLDEFRHKNNVVMFRKRLVAFGFTQDVNTSLLEEASYSMVLPPEPPTGKHCHSVRKMKCDVPQIVFNLKYFSSILL